jgi:hypothetical protein
MTLGSRGGVDVNLREGSACMGLGFLIWDVED